MRYQNSDNRKTNTATVAICRDGACLGLRSVEHATWRALDAAEVYRAGQGLPFIGFSFHPQLRVVGSCLLFFRASLLFFLFSSAFRALGAIIIFFIILFLFYSLFFASRDKISCCGVGAWLAQIPTCHLTQLSDEDVSCR